METLAVENYRSVRHLVLRLDRLTVVTGANGSGKSSLYRALRLLADAARDGAVAALAREGGFTTALWAGPDRLERREGLHALHSAVKTGPGLRLGFSSGAKGFGYAVDLGHPIPTRSLFANDPEIKTEAVWSGPVLRPAALLADRHGRAVRFRGRDGRWEDAHDELLPYDSLLSRWADPLRTPEVLRLREQMRSWRFYDHVRTDAGAPARGSRIGTRTPVLASDGADLAAALQTIVEIGDRDALAEAVDLAFPGSRVEVRRAESGRFELGLHQPGLLRPLGAAELSDGTLRYLLWTAALLTPRPPELMVLNEPETSLHPDLLAPLGRLIAGAAAECQTIVVTHSRALIRIIEELCRETAGAPGATVVDLVKVDGQTMADGVEPLDEPAWHWPKR